MDLRDENYLFSRRIADRGSDKNVFDSQDRKIQETDPKDVIWDDIVGKEEHPEEGDGYKFQETDSKDFIRDENCGKDYLENYNTLYPTPPRFDHYRDKRASKEETMWVTRALNGVTSQEGEPLGGIDIFFGSNQGDTVAMGSVAVDTDDDTVTTGYDSLFKVKHAAHNVDGEGSSVAHGELETTAGFSKVCLETHSLIPVDTFDLTNGPYNLEFQIANHINYAMLVKNGDVVACGNIVGMEGYMTATGGDESLAGIHATFSMDPKNYGDLLFLKALDKDIHKQVVQIHVSKLAENSRTSFFEERENDAGDLDTGSRPGPEPDPGP